jgi:hypothetical protein
MTALTIAPGRKPSSHRTRALRAPLLAAVLLSGCLADGGSDASAAADADGASTEGPVHASNVVGFADCEPSTSAPTWSDDIAAILDEHCGDCHGGGSLLVPSLVTYADLVATNDAGVPLFERVAVRMDQNNMPPSNLAPMLAGEREAVFAWVAACAPETPAGLQDSSL